MMGYLQLLSLQESQKSIVWLLTVKVSNKLLFELLPKIKVQKILKQKHQWTKTSAVNTELERY